MGTPSEGQIQTAVRDTLRLIDGFKDERVTINDYSPLDFSYGDTVEDPDPIVVIINSDGFTSDQSGYTARNNWEIGIDLLIPYTPDSRIARDLFRHYRDLIVAKFNEVGSSRSPGSEYGSVIAKVIRSGAPIAAVFDTYSDDPKDVADRIPTFLSQLIILEVETY